MKKSTISLSLSAVLFSGIFFTSSAIAEGRLVVYCSAQNSVCEKQVQSFAKKYNVDASFIRNSSGSTLAKIKAETK